MAALAEDVMVRNRIQEEVAKQVAARFQGELDTLRTEFDERLSAVERRQPADKVSIVVFSGDMDKILGAFVIANGAPVSRTATNGPFRAPQECQGKARRAGNGNPLPNGATQPWRSWGAPFGRAAGRPSAALRPLEAGRLPQRGRALRLTVQRLAERAISRSAGHLMGMEVSMFFTFWGLAAVKKRTHLSGKAFKQKLFSLMTPSKLEETGISKLNFAGMGPAMMKQLMKEKNVASVGELRDIAREMDTRMLGCTMSMDVMGVDADELIDGVELGGVAAFMEDALNSRVTLFI